MLPARLFLYNTLIMRVTDDECRMQVYQSNKFLLSSNLLLVFLAIAILTANIRDATLHGNLDLGTNPGLNLLP